MLDFFHTTLYTPFYNALLYLSSVIPGADIGIAVILLTLVVKFALLPLTHKSTKAQAKLRTLNPEIEDIKNKHKEDKQEQARKMMELYKKHKVNPFSSCFAVLIQLPIILSLYWVFFQGLRIDPEVAKTVEHMSGFINTTLLNTDILYAFVEVPKFLKTEFLGFIDMTGKSIILALGAGVSQFFQMRLSLPPQKGSVLQTTGSLKDDLAKNMGFQMRYILPVVIFIVAYTISAAVALYWTTNNLFSIVHELFVKRKMARQTTENNDGEPNTDDNKKPS